MRSIALFKVGRDYGVTSLDLKIAGLKDTGEKPSRYANEFAYIEGELVSAVPALREMYSFDTILEDMSGRRYYARFYAVDGVVYYAVLISQRGTVRGLVKRLVAQGWRLLFMIEKKVVKKNLPSETDVR
ncbi:hypothetical protein HC235_05320 [Pyrobaculum arsenaticum]|nr:hypothetical protein [Pyrobaculum arsenaticum]